MYSASRQRDEMQAHCRLSLRMCKTLHGQFRRHCDVMILTMTSDDIALSLCTTDRTFRDVADIRCQSFWSRLLAPSDSSVSETSLRWFEKQIDVINDGIVICSRYPDIPRGWDDEDTSEFGFSYLRPTYFSQIVCVFVICFNSVPDHFGTCLRIISR